MIRNLIFLLCLFIVCSFDLKQNLSVTMQVPDKVMAGESFQVTLVIEKGVIQSFSRFQQDLPFGLTAERVTSANADFSFEDQRVRFIWLKMPSDPKINVVYNIKVKENLKGSFTMDGEFSLVQGNDKKSIPVSAGKRITIVPNPSVAENLLTDINDYGKDLLARRMAAPLQVMRKTPRQINPKEILVEIKVVKGDLQKFAKIEEYLPEGYEAVEGQSKNGVFSFENHTVKILWMNLPAEPDFIVSYKVIPEKGKTSKNLNISGFISYISGNQTKSIDITSKDFDLPEVKDEREKPVQLVLADKNRVEKKDSVSLKPVLKEDYPVTNSGRGYNLLKPGKGIYFRIQVLASHEIVAPGYFKTLKIDREVEFENHQGWRKYTVGSFSTYNEAHDYLVKVWKISSVSNAFIVAYKNGLRIDIQEAMMVSR